MNGCNRVGLDIVILCRSLIAAPSYADICMYIYTTLVGLADSIEWTAMLTRVSPWPSSIKSDGLSSLLNGVTQVCVSVCLCTSGTPHHVDAEFLV